MKTQNSIHNMKAFIAGVLIGLGVIANTVVTVPIVGAVLFSFGLLMIIHFQFQLYTGKIGGLNFTPIDYCCMLMLNLAGVWITVVLYILAFPHISSIIITVGIAKFSKTILQCFISAIFCGILVHLACKSNNKFFTLMAVTIFILIGADHCVAIFPYYMLVPHSIVVNIWKFLAVIAGNSVGAIGMEWVLKECEK